MGPKIAPFAAMSFQVQNFFRNIAHDLSRKVAAPRKGLLSIGMLLLPLVPLLTTSGCQSTLTPKGLTAAKNFDGRKFEGTWHQILRSDIPEEAGLSCISYQFKRVDQDEWTVILRGWNSADGRWQGSTQRGVALKEQASGTIRLGLARPRTVAIIDEEHTMAVLCGKKYRHFAVFSKNPDPEPQRLERMLAAAREVGFPVEETFFVPTR